MEPIPTNLMFHERVPRVELMAAPVDNSASTAAFVKLPTASSVDHSTYQRPPSRHSETRRENLQAHPMAAPSDSLAWRLNSIREALPSQMQQMHQLCD